MFPWDKKTRAHKKVADKNVLIPWYPISYLMIAGYGFFFGRLRVPTRCCDLVVPADWGWGRSNEKYGVFLEPPGLVYETEVTPENLFKIPLWAVLVWVAVMVTFTHIVSFHVSSSVV